MDGEDDELHPEERTAARQRILMGGQLNFGGAIPPAQCMVRDVSETGARVKVRGLSHLPKHFELVIELEGLALDCERMWWDGTEAGVKFVSEPREVKTMRSQIVTASTKTRLSLRK